MAARKTPSAGSKPDKLMRDALMLELHKEYVEKNGTKTKKYRRIAANLVEMAEDGKMEAIKEIWDRVEGRPAQSVALGQDPELAPIGIDHSIRPQLSRDEWLKLHGGK